jgi:hypothetical protein
MKEYAEARAGSIPPRAVNGGLFTGQKFDKNSPWGNVPIVPDSNNYIMNGLLIGHTPPPGARTQTIADRPSSKHGPEGPVKYVKVLNMTFPNTCKSTSHIGLNI